MKQVTKEAFFNALADAGKQGRDPMPVRNSDEWVCQKTRKLFGKSVNVKGYGNKWDYSLLGV